MHSSSTIVLLGIVFTCASAIFAQAAPQSEPVPASLQGTWTLVNVKSDQTDQFTKEALTNHRMQEMQITGDQFKWTDGRSLVTKAEIIRIKPGGEDGRWEVDFSVDLKGNPHLRYGILEVQKDRLQLCFNTVEPADKARRPLDFKLATPRLGNILFEYDRKK